MPSAYGSVACPGVTPARDVTAAATPGTPNPPVRISAAAARRIALAAQGFADPRPAGRIDRRHLRKVLDHVGLVQIDSVNIVARSHEVPIFARLGDHPRNALVEAARRHEVFEYWGHEASFIPVEHQPLLRHKMAAAEQGQAWSGLVRIAAEHPQLIVDVEAEVLARGPLRAGELSMAERRTGPWWGWNDAQKALAWLFWCGRIGAGRLDSFERVYGAPELFVPRRILEQPTRPAAEQRRELLVLAARSLGVATLGDLADYHRLKVPACRPLVQELVEDGRLLPATVEGWRQPAYLFPGARTPRRTTARALLTPFDSLVWARDRTERLFGFRYRLEFYTPAPKRVYGYYVMPFLLDDRLPARVDLKADRKAGCLRVLAAYLEPGAGEHQPVARIAVELAAELRTFARFLRLDDVAVEPKGDLADALRAALGAAQ